MQKNIAYLGLGAWGFCLASLLAKKGHHVKAWSQRDHVFESLLTKRIHPFFPSFTPPKNLSFCDDLAETLRDAELIVESVSSGGVRPVCEKIKALQGSLPCPLVLTSKGIEQNSQLFLSQIVEEIFGEEIASLVGCLSGPSIAEEVLHGLPCSVVCSSKNPDLLPVIRDAFASPTFRVYPNNDLQGVELGGALKNVIAIAAGLSDGMNLGYNAKAGLVTRGLHEMRKLARALGYQDATITGLSGMGDLCVTCFCGLSRNYSFGKLLASGISVEAAKKQIGMVVEGSYTAVTAMQMADLHQVEMPISEGVFNVIYKNLPPSEALKNLLKRKIKAEHL